MELEPVAFFERFKAIEDKLAEDYDISTVHFEVVSAIRQKVSVLINIARNVALFLELRDIREFLVVNKKFNKYLLTKELCTHICSLLLKFSYPEKLEVGDVFNHFKDLTGVEVNNSAKLFKILANGRNLINNPGFDQGLDGWNVTMGGEGPILYDERFKTAKQCIRFSFRWGTIEQTINLPPGKNRILSSGVLVCRKCDCNSLMLFKVVTPGETKEIQKEVEGSKPGYSVYEWNVESVHLELPDDAQTATISFSGKDVPFWGGQYGPQVGYLFAFCFDVKQKKQVLYPNIIDSDDENNYQYYGDYQMDQFTDSEDLNQDLIEESAEDNEEGINDDSNEENNENSSDKEEDD